jgi:hypothetical protein
MQTKFKRHQKVKLLVDPDSEYIEYNLKDEEESPDSPPIKKGAEGKINILLPNGQYHVEILDKKGKILAYVPMNEEDLQSQEEIKDGESAED